MAAASGPRFFIVFATYIVLYKRAYVILSGFYALLLHFFAFFLTILPFSSFRALFSLIIPVILCFSGGHPHTFDRMFLVIGLLRTCFAGLWTYITSSVDHDMHDVGMIGYLVLSTAYHFGIAFRTRSQGKALNDAFVRRTGSIRLFVALLFVGTLVPLLYFFYLHKVEHIAGGAR